MGNSNTTLAEQHADSPSTSRQPETEIEQQQEQQQQQQQEEPEQDTQHTAATSAADGSSPKPGWRQRLIRWSIAAIQAVLLLELAVIVVPPLLPRRRSKRDDASAGDSSDTDSDLDPADVLMDYFTGRRGLTALQLLSNKQLRQAVDSLVTEDFQELGVKDRGAEIRDIVEGVIRVREEGPRPPPKEERVGLGKLGPLRFRNQPPARRATTSTAAAAAAQADEQQ